MKSSTLRVVTLGSLAALLAGFVALGIVRSRTSSGDSLSEGGVDSTATSTGRGSTGPGAQNAPQARNSGWATGQVPTAATIDSPQAQAAARKGMDVVSVKSLVSSMIDVADRGDEASVERTKAAIARYGPVAKEVLSQSLEKPGLSDPARNALRSTYEQIR